MTDLKTIKAEALEKALQWYYGDNITDADMIEKAIEIYNTHLSSAIDDGDDGANLMEMRLAMHETDCPHKDALSVRDIELLAQAASRSCRYRALIRGEDK